MPQPAVIRGSGFRNWACQCIGLTSCVIGFAQTQGHPPSPSSVLHAATRALPVENSPPLLQPGIKNQNDGPGALASTLTPLHWSELTRLRSLAKAEKPVSTAGKTSTKTQAMTAADAAWILGLLSVHGIAMPIDTDQARKWFTQAAGQGLLLAHAGLAWCAIEECRSPADPATAQASIEQLRKINAPRALYLQWLNLTRRAQSLQESASKEHMQSAPESDSASPALPYKGLLLEAADKGDVQARIELGIDSAAHMQFNESLAYFNAAAKDSSVAQSNAKIMAERIQQIAGQKTSLDSHLPGKNADSLLKQARRHHRGEGVPANFTEAIRLYRMAASAGSVEAEKMLRLIYAKLTPDGQIDLIWMQQLQDIDLTSPVPHPSGPTAPFWLRREPTALYDLLPPMWRLLK